MTDDKKTKLRIVSDGTPKGTRVETEDGKLVKGVQSVDWHVEIGGFARVQVEVLAVPLDVVGLVEDDGSVPEDPTAVPYLSEPQKAPDGPGITVFSRDDCVFRYCPNPDLCQDECEHRRGA